MDALACDRKQKQWSCSTRHASAGRKKSSNEFSMSTVSLQMGYLVLRELPVPNYKVLVHAHAA